MQVHAWIVRTGQRGFYRYVGEDGKDSAQTLGEAHVFTSYKEACNEADLWTNGVVEQRFQDDWRTP